MTNSVQQLDAGAITALARTIYQGARSQNPEKFQNWALEQMQKVIPFDSSIWGSGFILNGETHPHAIHLFNLPKEVVENYFKYQKQDPRAVMLAKNPGITLDGYDSMPREKFVKTEIYKNHYKLFGMEQTLTSSLVDPVTMLQTVVTIHRKDYAEKFTAAEKTVKAALTQILIHSYNLNLFLNLNQPKQHTTSCSAICDAKGILREAEPSFSELMLKEWPEWRGPQLRLVPETLLNNSTEAQFSGERITINISTQHDLILLQAREKNRLDTLTPAEKAVADQLMQGLSNKGIANNLNISPKTVSHHLQSIYKKTDVANRQQAISQLKGEL